MRLQDGVNEINLGSGGLSSDQFTGISHREYGEPVKTAREMHRNE